MTDSPKRSYCLNDRPNPVGRKRLNTLRDIRDANASATGFPALRAPAQVESLRIAGYVRLSPEKNVSITAAGLALLERSGETNS